MKINIGLDIGNLEVDATDGKHEVYFDAGYSITESDPDMIWNGTGYSFDRHLEPEVDKLKSERMMAMSLGAIGKLLVMNGADESETHRVNLGVCLALNIDNAENREGYRKYYAGKMETITIDGTVLDIVFENVKVYPQGICVIAQNASKFRKYGFVNVVDIGGKTVDACAIEFDDVGKPHKQNKESINKGSLSLMRPIMDSLAGEGISLTPSMISSIISGGTCYHRKKDRIIERINTEKKRYIPDLETSLQNRGFDMGRKFIIVGGSGDMIKKDLERDIDIVESYGRYGNAKACQHFISK